MDNVVDIIKAANTIEETIALRNNHILEKAGDYDNESDIISNSSTVIDVDNAKWQKDYSTKMDSNLDKLKKLGLYQHLQDLGILYDPSQFKKNSIIMKDSSGKQIMVDGDLDAYEESEKQFDENEKR